MLRSFLLTLLILSPLFGQTRTRVAEYALVLEDAPVAASVVTRADLDGVPAQAHLARVQLVQRSVRAELAARGIAVNGVVQLLANAVFVTATPEQAAGLPSIPGVNRVQRMPRLKRTLNRALDLVGVPAAWNSLGGAGNAGAGVKIGIIDTGIDQNHPGFQDNTLPVPAGFPKGDTAFTNRKVIVARSYVPQLVYHDSKNDPRFTHPDDLTPRDRFGHGTAIAMIAAGVGVSGPAAAIQGVAPKAFLGNYKIFGSPGVNNFTLYSALAKAMDDSFTDGMDIVTFSLNEADPAVYGPLDSGATCNETGTNSCDVRAQLIENAVGRGMVVVAAAGNDGDLGPQYPSLASIHTPGTAPSAITVGASTNSHILFAGVTPQGGGRINAIFGAGGRIDAAFTAPLKDVAATGNDGLACASLAAGSLAGTVALVARGTCALTDKIYYAQTAGAVGVIIYNSAGSDYPVEILAQDVGIPNVGVGNADGLTLKNLARSPVNVTLDPALRAVDAAFNTLWSSSSRGPSAGNFAFKQDFSLKPELVAVGTDLYTATQRLDPNGDAYDATGYTTVTGTSFAVPMVAGAAALVKQKNPSLRPLQIKSALVNTATQDVTDNNGRARVTDVGAGKLNAANAINVAVAADPAGISFGAIGTASLPANVTLRLSNVSSASASVSLAVNQRDADARASVRVTPSTLTLGAGQQSSVTVTLQGTRPNAGAYEGFIDINITTGAGSALHVPYYYVVGDGQPFNAYPVINGAFTGVLNDTDWTIGFKLTDRYGAPVANSPVTWKVNTGGGKVVQADTQTDRLGIAAANVTLGAQGGDQIFVATAGSSTVQFNGFAGPLPTIKAGGVVDAATNTIDRGLAAGSYIAIYGDSLASTVSVERTASLPLSLATVSVSFDAGPISAPGHLHFVSPTQVNVQIPWEMQGQTSAQMKVTIAPDISSALYTVPLAAAAPQLFVREGVAAVRDVNFAIVNSANPARRGQAVQLYCNGLGQVDNTPVSGDPSPAPPSLANTRVLPTVTIGSRPAQVLFSGLAPGNVGLYQVNVIVPNDAPTGSQPVVVSVGGVDSKPANMPVQ